MHEESGGWTWLYTLLVVQVLVGLCVGGYFLYKRYGMAIKRRLVGSRFFYDEQDNLYERLN